MTPTLTIERALWAATLAGVAGGGISLVRGPAGGAPPPALAVLPAAVHPPHPDSLTRASETISDGNLFRPNRESSAAQPVAAMTGITGYLPPPPPPLRPMLVLRGIVGGPPWSVVVLGVPGTEGPVVLRQGERTGDLELRAVRRDTAFVRGRDTTWRLTMGRAW